MSGSVSERKNGKWRATYRDEKKKSHSKHFSHREDAEYWLLKETGTPVGVKRSESAITAAPIPKNVADVLDSMEKEIRIIRGMLTLEPSKTRCLAYDPLPEDHKFNVPSAVYLMRRSDGAIKIGYTKDIPKRKAELELNCGPLDVIAFFGGGHREETALHRRYRQDRISNRREWFRWSEEIDEFVQFLLRGGYENQDIPVSLNHPHLILDDPDFGDIVVDKVWLHPRWWDEDRRPGSVVPAKDLYGYDYKLLLNDDGGWSVLSCDHSERNKCMECLGEGDADLHHSVFVPWD